MKKTLGGDRLGSGKKMQVDLHNYGRSTHNLSREWRSTMAQGTLVPFLVEPILPGDSFDIDLNTMVRTMPTLGPIFGTMKMQLDVFLCPMRLYIAELHNNKLGVGMNMANVKLPKMQLTAGSTNIDSIGDRDINQTQINTSSILAYLGYRGLGKNNKTTINVTKQALPALMYWDIYKNYYANKQEKIGALISQEEIETDPISSLSNIGYSRENTLTEFITASQFIALTTPKNNGDPKTTVTVFSIGGVATIELTGKGLDQAETLILNFATSENGTEYQYNFKTKTITPEKPSNIGIYGSEFSDTGDKASLTMGITAAPLLLVNSYENGTAVQIESPPNQGGYQMAIKTFDLENIDNMREELLQQPSGTNVIINELNAGATLPYSSIYGKRTVGQYSMVTMGELSGLGLKTYLSDRFNNWLETEWIDGPNGIAAVSAVDTSSGSFTMDSLNLAQKIYNLLNRIAVSGGSYYDWTEAAYGETTRWQAETPMYMGGLSGELAFSEVVSTAESTDAEGGPQPLGSLAGRGTQIGERHGKIRVKAEEASFVIGIVSFTPRIDYCEGNKWYTRLDTMDDWHKPAFDGIGFQELITDEMAAWDTDVANNGTPTYKSAGKQPSWIEYMTSQNECYGGFAQNDSQMFMTFSRRYKPDENGNLSDLTTYIDPTKYNQAFAGTDLTAQNLWVQIGIKLHARRKMSAKMIPNL